jgi:hypothetical protein
LHARIVPFATPADKPEKQGQLFCRLGATAFRRLRHVSARATYPNCRFLTPSFFTIELPVFDVSILWRIPAEKPGIPKLFPGRQESGVRAPQIEASKTGSSRHAFRPNRNAH